ncbi:hypothetical protein BKA58DRAFT_7182 [Alternaria rosae]|uniref:uncharacterized protein n=1 Tax=Alternaria rosae TaxID=1187941 RepID=UPI001E8D6F7B|nr:uncharacterized protein BKA58DRAFT_7182 [Alternaria rosae]KAH6881740.1 hypothetical protein BKA58DRAFT_7182 [Alternaria rosae]
MTILLLVLLATTSRLRPDASRSPFPTPNPSNPSTPFHSFTQAARFRRRRDIILTTLAPASPKPPHHCIPRQCSASRNCSNL